MTMAGKTIRYRARVELLNNDAWNIPLHSESDIDFVYNETVVRARATDGNVIMFPVRNVTSIKIAPEKKDRDD